MLTYRAVTEFYVLSWVWYFWLLATGLDGLLVAVCSEGSVHLHPVFGSFGFCSALFHLVSLGYQGALQFRDRIGASAVKLLFDVSLFFTLALLPFCLKSLELGLKTRKEGRNLSISEELNKVTHKFVQGLLFVQSFCSAAWLHFLKEC